MNNKKIAIIELETHSALLEQWYLLLAEMISVDFHFFVHQKVMDKLTTIPVKYITLIENVSEIETQINTFDAVIVDTLHRNFEQYNLIFSQKPTLTLVHNLNFSLFFKSIDFSNFWLEKQRFGYYLKLYLSEKVHSKRKAILKSTRFGVLSESLLKTIQSEDKELEGKSEVLQLNYCQSSVQNSSTEIKIVMPGNVSNKRKDIKMLFEILPKLNPKSNLHFVFLGKPESEVIVKQIEFLKQNCDAKIAVTYYAAFIPWQEYSAVISSADLLLCPIKNETSFYWVNEIYGQTKVSGAEADCIYNGKIGLFPTSYSKMNWHNLYYEKGEDLSQILNELTKTELELEYQKLQPYLKEYTFENVKNKLENQLLQLANTK